ncbi:hypothetical protein RND81_06G250200 [Saponaria officinalis]|uniref:RING-type E3 ubiquitin transferase n=1 Tax=Saponaria officinalis TaxID=3572 RepID=A0AAW1KEK3_SAPOF
MKLSQKQIPFIFYLLILLQYFSCYSKASIQKCPIFSCNPYEQDTIQFPFHVPRNQSSRCGYPGFDLSCGDSGRTYINISSKTLIVKGIDYPNQLLFVSDPNSCIPKRILTLNLTSTPYSYGPETPSYTFLNCSQTNVTALVLDPTQLPIGTSVVTCLSGGDYTVMTTFERASEERLVSERKCRVIKRVNAALLWPEMEEGFYPVDMSDVILQLSWGVPNCGDCLLSGGSCGFAHDSGLAVKCFFNDSAGLSKSAKYGLILGLGIPGLLCMIGLAYYASSRVRTRNQNQRRYNTELSPIIFPQPVILTVGLDRPTIESYPKTTLGESKRLPKTSDSTCPICLCEYQPKETLRSIPECNHYFHADCIDEWLRMNATCPLCRKSPHEQLYGAAGR